MNNNRILYLDVARIVAVVSMIMLHVTSYSWSLLPVTSFEWQMCNIYNSMVRFCVPLFVMISGVLFLSPNKEIPLEKLFKKNIFRVVVAFCFWSLCYSIIFTILQYHKMNSIAIIPLAILIAKKLVLGHFHLWFLYMIVGLYLIVPFLKKITADKKMTEYFLLLAFIFAIIVPGLRMIPVLSKSIQVIVQTKMNIYFVLGYSFYFVMGYYLSQHTYSGSKKYFIYALGILGVIFTIVMTSIVSLHKDQAIKVFYNNLLPNTAFVAVAWFIFIKDITDKIYFSDKMLQRISIVSKYSFGVYLVHAFFLPVMGKFHEIISPYNNSIFFIPLCTILIFVGSNIVVMVINKIPIVNRYII